MNESNMRDEIVRALAIDMIQSITKEEILGKMVEIMNDIKKEPTPSKKINFSEVPVTWHKAMKRTTSFVISDGLTKEGFLNYLSCDEFLGQYSGYFKKCLDYGDKIFSYPEMKEWHLIEMEGRKYGREKDN